MKGTLTLCLLLVYVHSYSQSDSIAVTKLIERAAITFRSGDAKTYADCWKIQPYSVIAISTADGKVVTIPADSLVKPSASMGKGGFAVNTNYIMSLHTDNGWVGFNEVSTAKDGTKTYSFEIWMVEKIKGDWKLVAASLHFYHQP